MLIIALLTGVSPTQPPPCRLATAESLTMVPDHRRLRSALGVAMPAASTMVLLYGEGGHHVTRKYSIIVARGTDGVWRGSAVGRDEPWPDPSAATTLPASTWTLDPAAGRALDAALARPCAAVDPLAAPSPRQEPPPRDAIGEHVDVLIDGRVVSSGTVGEGGETVSALARRRN